MTRSAPATTCRSRSIAADFSKGDTVRVVVEAVGHADILVNNAGAIPRGDILTMTEAKWREAWELKMFGYVNATRAMLEKMYARKKGAVVNIIGLAGESFNYDYVAGTTAQRRPDGLHPRRRLQERRSRRARGGDQSARRRAPTA